MPDLKTALTTALSSWEQDDQKIQQEKKLPKHIFTPTNNVTQETFNYVKNNPNKSSGEIRAALVARGFNDGSVGSLITQFTKQGQFVKDHNGKYKTIASTYTPLKSSKHFRAEGKTKVKTKVPSVKTKPRSEGIAALAPQVTATTQWDADTIINNIGLKQARALYDELKKLFGG